MSLKSHISKKSVLLLLILMVGLVLISELTNTTYLFHKKVVPPTIPAKQQVSKTKKKSSSPSSSSSSSTGNTDKSVAPANVSASEPLIPPFGSFVSNHSPGKNGSPTGEQSVCNTTPGATCYIQFTNVSSGTVTKLPAQTIDSNGSTAWNWNSKTLTSGKWQISAIASLNGQTKTTNDELQLNIE